MKSKLKIWLSLALLFITSQVGLMGYDPSRYNYDVTNKPDLRHVTTTLINNTDYSLWLTVNDPAMIQRLTTAEGPDESTEDYPFGFSWIKPGAKVVTKSDEKAPENAARLYYAKDPGFFTMGTVVNIDFKGKNSKASQSPDVVVNIHAEPVYMYYPGLLSEGYIYEWYNYTITVDSKNKKTSEKTEI